MVSASKWGDLLEDEEELPPSTTSGPDARGVVTKVEYYRNDKGEVMKKTTKTRVVKIEKKVYKVRPGGGCRRRRRRRVGGGARSPCSCRRVPAISMHAGAQAHRRLCEAQCRMQAGPADPCLGRSRCPRFTRAQVAQDRRAGWQKFGEAATERAADSVTSQTPDEVQLERIQRAKQTQEEKAKGAAELEGKKADQERKELGKGSEQGQAKREEKSRKWWKFGSKEETTEKPAK